MVLCMIHRDTKRIPHTFESIFPPQGLSLSVPFIITSDVAGSEIERNIGFVQSSHMFHLTCEISWGSRHGERTTDIYQRMLPSQMTPGSLGHQGRHLKDLCNSMHVIGTDATTSDLLVSLPLPMQLRLQGIYVNSTWLGRAWRTDWPRAGGPARCTSHDFLQFSGVLPPYHDHHSPESIPVMKLPSHRPGVNLPALYTYCHHLCVLEEI